ncbi:hypothetical protein ACOI1C_17460 [Bacillus sp. DJP31]|uniref:hypothetical protein n=1 Tax=Bacillus sp. DJP31 TaxID=3409789 RepID=UPI003BB63D3B
MNKEKQEIPLDLKVTPILVGINEFVLVFGSDKIKKVEFTMETDQDSRITYNAFKTDKGTFRVTGINIQKPGVNLVSIKAFTVDNSMINYDYQINVPGEDKSMLKSLTSTIEN